MILRPYCAFLLSVTSTKLPAFGKLIMSASIILDMKGNGQNLIELFEAKLKANDKIVSDNYTVA